ncbi:MAG TPA: hypothetical protein VMT71_01895 [Syntrophorhabdales bacterium]|nr:hypothetical protein [Syntrophorhabdales bacterium]
MGCKATLALLVAVVLFAAGAEFCSGADSFAAYQVTGTDPQFWSMTRDFLKEKGYEVLYQQGESDLERHLEKMSRINRSPAKFLLAMELAPGPNKSVLVAMTDRKEQGSGGVLQKDTPPFAPDASAGRRFFAIDDLQGKYSADSGMLADSVATSFQVKVKHVPLFPLLGANMPGIFLRIECKQDAMREMLGLLHSGIQNYLRRDISHERQRQGER